MKYYLYMIRNLVNNKIYIGVHRTENLDDGYMGSGVLLKRAQKKHGIENFEKKILKFFETEKEMYQEEASVVSEEFVLREDTYNLIQGGDAGWRETGLASRNNKTGIHSRKGREGLRKWQRTPEGRASILKNLEKARLAASTPEARENQKEAFRKSGHAQGEKNSQFGKKWITDGKTNKKVDKDDPLPKGWRSGRVIK